VKNSVRIIGGVFRGKKLSFPQVQHLRPTPDRVRETLFNWLMQSIRHAVCLDAFAGSGALGFEALSRGAEKVVLVEQAHEVYENLKKSAASFATTNVEVCKSNALDYIKNTTQRFDIIFLDPPFTANYLEECLRLLSNSQALNPGGLIYIESPSEFVLDSLVWKQLKSKKAGQVVYGLYQKTS
jgi:16S rRNA (guanine966-N2)-methyltransferase